MANKRNGTIKVGVKIADLDHHYGPYKSVKDAIKNIKDVALEGRRFGVEQEDGSVIDYTYQGRGREPIEVGKTKVDGDTIVINEDGEASVNVEKILENVDILEPDGVSIVEKGGKLSVGDDFLEGVSTISIKPTDTATYLNALPNGVYRASSAGTYQFTTLPDYDVVVNKVIPPGYSVKFLKSASGWSVSVVEKLPMQDLEYVDKSLIYNNPLIYSRSSIDSSLIYSLSDGLIIFFKVSLGQKLTITRPSVQGNRFRIMKIAKSNLPVNGDILTDVYNDAGNTLLSYEWTSDINGYGAVYLTTGSVYDQNVDYSINVSSFFKSSDVSFVSQNTEREVLLDLVRGSLTDKGELPIYSYNRTWRDNEFYKNVRLYKFLNIQTDFISIENYTELSLFNIYILEYDSSFNFIKKIKATSKNIKLSPSTRNLKFYLNKIDSSVISSIPNMRVKSIFGSNIYNYAKSIYDKTQQTLISVKPNVGRDDLTIINELVNYQIDNEDYYTNIIVRTPLDYYPNGSSKRVIMFAHSSDGAENTDFNANYLPYVKYLVDEGYIVIDVFAWTNKQLEGFQYSATPTNIACVNALYKFVSENYNIKRDGVFVFGKSRGGFQAYTAEYHFKFPVLAVGSLAGAIYPFKNNYGYATTDINTSMRDFNITEDPSPISKEGGADYRTESRAWFLRNIEYFKGYIPLFMGALNVTNEQILPVNLDFDNLNFTAISRVPTKTWVSPDDPIGVKEILCRKRAVERGQGVFEIRYMQNGSSDPHHTVDTLGPFISLTTKLGVLYSRVPVAWVEMLQFFKRYDV